jgi:putative ABC transport system ATP-binding protein
MNKISLQQTLPNVFLERTDIQSDLWKQDVVFEKGHIYLVEADSGTGKSSLCSYVYGYRNDYQGSILFDGTDVRMLKIKDWVEIRKKAFSILFQELRLFSELSALENIEIKNNLTKFKTKKQIIDLFDQFGIGDKLFQKCGKLSFGQQQRVAFIRSLCQPFDFVFLDEPISHLDDTNSSLMGDMLMEEVKRQGSGVICTSIGKHIELDYEKKFTL